MPCTCGALKTRTLCCLQNSWHKGRFPFRTGDRAHRHGVHSMGPALPANSGFPGTIYEGWGGRLWSAAWSCVVSILGVLAVWARRGCRAIECSRNFLEIDPSFCMKWLWDGQGNWCKRQRQTCKELFRVSIVATLVVCCTAILPLKISRVLGSICELLALTNSFIYGRSMFVIQSIWAPQLSSSLNINELLLSIRKLQDFRYRNYPWWYEVSRVQVGRYLDRKNRWKYTPMSSGIFQGSHTSSQPVRGQVNKPLLLFSVANVTRLKKHKIVETAPPLINGKLE